MAKWGEGDPRWIVEERADATNVNNWHWTEKNATHWSKDKLKELLNGFKIENEEYFVKIKEVTKCEGEASANNRKAKLIFFYEWVITGDWEATIKNSEDPKKIYKGSFEVTNLSEEHDPMEVDISITLKDSKQEKLKDFMRSFGTNKLREQLAKYVQLLKEEFSQGLILPTKDSSSSLKATSDVKSNSDSKNASISFNSNSKNIVQTSESNHATKILTSKLTMNEEFKCMAFEIYQVFVSSDMVKMFTHSSKILYEPEKGGKFALFDGNITGSFVELVPNRKIVMNWRYKAWPDEHYSVATIEFNEKEDHTLLTLTQTGVPQNFVENTKAGWRNFYWNAIRQTFGYGVSLS